MDNGIPRMVSIREAAELTGLSKICIRKLCWENKICYKRSGSKYLINLQKFSEYLNDASYDYSEMRS